MLIDATTQRPKRRNSKLKPVRVGVIGAGWFATSVHIPAISGRADVVLDTICRLGAEELDRARTHFGFTFATEDFNQALSRNLDAVIVATPHHLHYEIARAALERGCDVLVEKPLCLRAAEAWELVRIARCSRRHLLVANGWHYKPRIGEARRLIDEVGDIEHVLCHMASGTRAVFSGNTGLRRWSEAFFRPDPGTWQDPNAGGGYAYGQLSHAPALLFWITGLRACEVQAQSYSEGSDVDLHNAAMLRFRGGAIGAVSGTCGLPEGHRFELDLRVYGSRGRLTLDLERERLDVVLTSGRQISVPVPPGQWAYSCEGPANALIDLARGRGENKSPGDVGARAVEVIEAMIKSAQGGGAPVNIQTE